MKRTFAASILTLITVASAQAAERDARESTMNQAGSYERTMKCYLHPAHGFPGVASNRVEHSAVVTHRSGVKSNSAFGRAMSAQATHRSDRCQAALCRAPIHYAQGAQPGMALATELTTPAALAQQTDKSRSFNLAATR